MAIRDVAELIGENFLAIQVDQDSRPDIANKYEDWGWPATIVFDSDGREIAKRRGFIPPKAMLSLLKACVADPTPGPSIETPRLIHPATQPALSGQSVAKLKKDLVDFYDEKNGGWGLGFKFVDPDLIEYCMRQSSGGDKDAERMARQTLNAGLNLIDPAWGGVYQYSTDAVWNHPHFEKIMSFQAGDLQTYARAFSLWHDPAYLKAAVSIHHYLTTFLLDSGGAFYTSQDADRVPGEHGGDYFALNDFARCRLGLPKIDKHMYARENGWAISALCALHQSTADEKTLSQAIAAANWIVANRSRSDGGFTHGDSDPAGPFLGDTVAMGRAFMDLYGATGDLRWLKHAMAASDFIQNKFVPVHEKISPGVITAVGPAGAPEVDENIAVVRFARELHERTRAPLMSNLPSEPCVTSLPRR